MSIQGRTWSAFQHDISECLIFSQVGKDDLSNVVLNVNVEKDQDTQRHQVWEYWKLKTKLL